MAGSSPSRNLMDLHPPLNYQPSRNAIGRPFPFYTGPRHPSPRRRETGLPGYLCATALAMGLGTVALIHSPAVSGPVRSLISIQKDLREALGSPNLNSRIPAPSPLALDVPLPELPETVWSAPPPTASDIAIAPPVSSQESTWTRVAQIAWPAAELPAFVSAPDSAPAYVDLGWNPPYLARQHRGDTPMSRNWKNLAFLAATVVYVHQPVHPVMAQTAQESPDLTKIYEKLNSIQITLNGLKDVPTDITYLKKEYERLFNNVASQQTEILKTNKRLEDLELLVKLLKVRTDNGATSVTDNRAMDDLKYKIDQLERMLAKLETQPAQSRLALSPPSTPSMARVVLVNLYPRELLFLINNRTQRVAPRTTVTLESIPAGTLNYEVISENFGVASKNTVSVQANETFTLTARE